MTRLPALTAAACLAASIAPVFTADGPLDRAASVLGVDAIQSLEFEASGRYYQFGQAPAPELPWPAFDVTGYTATLDYARAAVHAKYRRVQVQEPGRARPHTDQTQDRVHVDGRGWNLTPAPRRYPPTSRSGTPSCGRRRRASSRRRARTPRSSRPRPAAARPWHYRRSGVAATRASSARPATCSGCARSSTPPSPATRRWNGASASIAMSAACASRPASRASSPAIPGTACG